MTAHTGDDPAPVKCFGAVHWDIIVHAAHPIVPETSTPAQMVHKPGGVATNVARALARLNVPTTLAGLIGDDTAGKAVNDQLAAEGIVLVLHEQEGGATGQYVAFHDPDGSLPAACVDDRILSAAGPDAFADIIKVIIQTVAKPQERWFVDANLPESILQRIAASAPAGGLVADGVSRAKVGRLRCILKETGLLFLNAAEARVLTRQNASVPAEELTLQVRALGASSVVVSEGAGPIHYADADGTGKFQPENCEIVDVTGAGDALIAGTLAALTRGWTLAKALPVGLRAARLTLQTPGAVPDRLAWDTVTDTA